MDRLSGVCKATSQFNPLAYGVAREQLHFLEHYGFIGLITIEDINFVVVITEAAEVTSMRGSPLMTIRNVEFIPFTPQERRPTEALMHQIQGLTRLLTTGFFFSANYDLTNCLQKQFEGRTGSIHDRADPRFYWNFEMFRELSLQSVDTKWFLPIIQGFIGTDTNFIGGNQVIVVIISRRSCYRAGTRFNARGVDDEGNVANFVETEQILIVHDCCFSLIQLRGSVPVFWEQMGVSASITLTRSHELTTQAFMKHFEGLVRHYRHVMIVNLLSAGKATEHQLTEAMQALLSEHNRQLSQTAAYVHFDFNSVCSGSKLYNLKALLNQIGDMMNYYLYFYVQRGQVVCQQKGAVRINCLDCLDRSNIVMSRIAWQSLSTQLGMLGIPLDFDFDDSTLTHPFVKSFKNMWAENGDVLAFEYTGTGSTSASVTRTGKQGIKGFLDQGLKSISRIYQANVEDNSRQESIDLLLKRKAEGAAGHLMSHMKTEVTAREDEYSSYTTVTLQVCSWNMGGRKPPANPEALLPLLLPDVRPDVIVVALQEIVKLSALNALPGSNTTTVGLWVEVLAGALRQAPDQYIHVRDEDMFGCLICIFAKKSIASSITRIESDKIKTGFKGKLGNKGSVMIRFNIYDTSVVIWNCHLASGDSQIAARCSQLEDIQQRGFQQDVVGRPKSYTVDDHNVKILVGDLNFRIGLSNFDVRRLVAARNLQALLQHDQLLNVKPRHPLLSRYTEPQITFLPTYKYDVNTHDYDSSRKQRSPAWCDRILYSGSQIFAHCYNRVELLHSDHRPVYATFEIKVKAVDSGRKSIVEMEVYSQLHGRRSEPVPSRSMLEARSSTDLLTLETSASPFNLADESRRDSLI